MENNKYITVSALNRYLQYRFDNDKNLQMVYLKAEISNIRLVKGILYFSLKDNESEIDGIMFSNVYRNLKFKPVDGMTVLVTGKVGIYIRRGRYSITALKMEESGLGDAYLQFLQIKDKLQREGLFDPKYKQPIPKMSEKIGVVTSATGDAIQDIQSTIENRFPLAQIYLYPSLVQGQNAPKNLIAAIKKANKDNIVDILIITRGGGSIEDLSCFNDEALARVIFESKIPTVSAVGHESDFTIIDFVSSMRAPTPTGAAVLVTRDKKDIINELKQTKRQLSHLFRRKLIDSFNDYDRIINSYGFKNFADILKKKEDNLNNLMNHLHLVSPKKLIEASYTKVDDLQNRLKAINLSSKIDNLINEVNDKTKSINYFFKLKINDAEKVINQRIDKLILLNPLNLMQKGYTVTYQDKKILSSIKQVDKDKKLITRFSDGKVISIIEEVEK